MLRTGSIGTPLLAIALAAMASLAWVDVGRAAEAAGEAPIYVSPSPDEATGDLAPGAAIVTPGEPITVDEAVALAIQNSLDVQVERYAPLIARSFAQEVWGAYDPQVDAFMQYDVTKSPNTFGLNSVANNRDRVKGGSVGVTQLLPYLGASLSARYGASSVSTRSSIQTLSDQYNADFFITAKVPLARGLIWNAPWTSVKVAKHGYRASQESFRGKVMDTVLATVGAYWNLVAKRDQVRVAQKSLDTARALLEQTQTQYEVGVVSRVEVVEAEAGVADREFNVITKANEYRNAQDRLIDVVLGPELTATTELQFSPTGDPADFDKKDVDVAEAVARAFSLRPELRSLGERINQREVELKFAKNQRLPRLDAEVEFGYVGISGQPNPRLNPLFCQPPDCFPPVSRPFDQADDSFFTDDGSDNLRVMGTFSIPFPNTTARKRVVQRKLELQRAESQRTRLEQSIIQEIRTAARTLEASAQGIEASERRRLAAEEQLRAERIRLEHGESTPFLVLEKEEDLVEAESQRILALQTYRVAEVSLDRAEGTILDVHRVEIESVREPAR
jgi:outer membrane protein TolC